MNKSAVTALLTPTKGQAADKRIWGIPLNGVWIPFFTATNVAGDTAISHEALGAPVRLAKEKDGTPKLSKTGKAVMRVVKEITDVVNGMRGNFSYGLLAYAAEVQKEHAEYKALVLACQKAGEPLVRKDNEDWDAFLAELEPAATPAVAEAEAILKADKPKGKRSKKAAPAAVEITPSPEPELAAVA